MSGRAKWLLAACLCTLPMQGNAAPRQAAEARRAAPAGLPVKPGGPIAVEHRLAAELAVGVAATITITARAEGVVGELRVEAAASRPSAVLLTAPTLVAITAGTYSWELTVVPLAADAGYLNVIVAGDIDGLAQARSVAIPLRGATVESRPKLEARSDTETLIALPVRETP